MKTKIFTLFVIISMSTMVMAQSSQLATLNHKGQITTFYGATALTKAHNAATHGDVITLSSGSFNGVDITKAVTIRGAGMGLDTVSNAMPTIINSDFAINVPSMDTANLILEGVYHNGTILYLQATHPMFIKCRFRVMYEFNEYSEFTDATFMHCYVAVGISLSGSSTISTFYNSIVGTFCGNLFEATNLAYNCIGYVRDNGSSYCKPKNENIFENIPNNTTNHIEYVTDNELFESYDLIMDEDPLWGDYAIIDDNQFFNLSKNAKEQYKGNDGTEVGIYGGNMPFDPRTTMPQITKCNVAAKSTADGKLSVDIEVSGIE